EVIAPGTQKRALMRKFFAEGGQNSRGRQAGQISGRPPSLTARGADRHNGLGQDSGSKNTWESKSKCFLSGFLNRRAIFGSDWPADRLVATDAGTLMIGAPAALWVIVKW